MNSSLVTNNSSNEKDVYKTNNKLCERLKMQQLLKLNNINANVHFQGLNNNKRCQHQDYYRRQQQDAASRSPTRQLTPYENYNNHKKNDDYNEETENELSDDEPMRTVCLRRSSADSKLGFSLRGGKALSGHSVGVFVSHVEPQSEAWRSGLKVGDRLVTVNGLSAARATYAHVIGLIKERAAISSLVELTVQFAGKVPVQDTSGAPIKWLQVPTQCNNDLDEANDQHYEQTKKADKMVGGAVATPRKSRASVKEPQAPGAGLNNNPNQNQNNQTSGEPASLDEGFGGSSAASSVATASAPSSASSACGASISSVESMAPASPAVSSSSSSTSQSNVANVDNRRRQQRCFEDDVDGDICSILVPPIELRQPFGASVVKGPDEWPGVFVQTVRASSLAQQVGLELGDQILEVSGVSLTNVSFDAAVSLIKTQQAAQAHFELRVKKGAALEHLARSSVATRGALVVINGDDDENSSEEHCATPKNVAAESGAKINASCVANEASGANEQHNNNNNKKNDDDQDSNKMQHHQRPCSMQTVPADRQASNRDDHRQRSPATAADCMLLMQSADDEMHQAARKKTPTARRGPSEPQMHKQQQNQNQNQNKKQHQDTGHSQTQIRILSTNCRLHAKPTQQLVRERFPDIEAATRQPLTLEHHAEHQRLRRKAELPQLERFERAAALVAAHPPPVARYARSPSPSRRSGGCFAEVGAAPSPAEAAVVERRRPSVAGCSRCFVPARGVPACCQTVDVGRMPRQPQPAGSVVEQLACGCRRRPPLRRIQHQQSSGLARCRARSVDALNALRYDCGAVLSSPRCQMPIQAPQVHHRQPQSRMRHFGCCTPAPHQHQHQHQHQHHHKQQMQQQQTVYSYSTVAGIVQSTQQPDDCCTVVGQRTLLRACRCRCERAGGTHDTRDLSQQRTLAASGNSKQLHRPRWRGSCAELRAFPALPFPQHLQLPPFTSKHPQPTTATPTPLQLNVVDSLTDSSGYSTVSGERATCVPTSTSVTGVRRLTTFSGAGGGCKRALQAAHADGSGRPDSTPPPALRVPRPPPPPLPASTDDQMPRLSTATTPISQAPGAKLCFVDELKHLARRPRSAANPTLDANGNNIGDNDDEPSLISVIAAAKAERRFFWPQQAASGGGAKCPPTAPAGGDLRRQHEMLMKEFKSAHSKMFKKLAARRLAEAAASVNSNVAESGDNLVPATNE